MAVVDGNLIRIGAYSKRQIVGPSRLSSAAELEIRFAIVHGVEQVNNRAEELVSLQVSFHAPCLLRFLSPLSPI